MTTTPAGVALADHATDASWRPGANEVAYEWGGPVAVGRPEIRATDTTTGETRTLVNFGDAQETERGGYTFTVAMNAIQLAWSPDGSRLAFVVC